VQADDADKENAPNETAKPTRSTRGKSVAPAPQKTEDDMDMSVFDPEPADPSEPVAKPLAGPRAEARGLQERFDCVSQIIGLGKVHIGTAGQGGTFKDDCLSAAS
jgi:hypothetical protein